MTFFLGGGGLLSKFSSDIFGVLLSHYLPACLPASHLPLPASPLLVSLKTQSPKRKGFIPLLFTLNSNILRDYLSLKPFIYRGLRINNKKKQIFIWWNELINYICERINQLITKK